MGKNTYSNHLAAEMAAWLQTMRRIVDESAPGFLWWVFRDTGNRAAPACIEAVTQFD